MKKLVSVALLVMLVVTLATTVKAATPSEELYNYISGTFTIAGQEVKLLTSGQLVQAKRYLDTHELTNDEYLHVKDQIVSTIEVMNEAGVTNVFDLEGQDLEFVKINAQAAAKTLGLTIDYNSSDRTFLIKETATGDVVASFLLDANNKLVQTDELHYEYIAISVVAIIAVAIVMINKKVTANA